MTTWTVEFDNPLDSQVIFDVTPELLELQRNTLLTVASAVHIIRSSYACMMNEDIIQCTIVTDSDDMAEVKQKINKLQLNYYEAMKDTKDYLGVPRIKRIVNFDEY